MYVQAILSIFAKHSGNSFLIKPQMDTRIHRNTSSEPLMTFLRRTIRSRQDVLFNFVFFLPKFGCHGNSLGSLKFQIAYLNSPTLKPMIHAKVVSISCTQMKLFLFECLASLLLYVQAILSFFAKNSGNCFLIKSQMDTEIHRNTSYEPLTTFLRRMMRSRQDVLFNFGFFAKIWLPWQLPWLP